METSLVVIFFLLGSALGSFAHCVASRTLDGESWLKNPSYCFNCRKKIKWYQNIPLFSWLALRGRSACCHQKIPVDYFLVELFSALVVMGLFARLSSVAFLPAVALAQAGAKEEIIPYSILFSAILMWVFLLVLGLVDLKSKLLPSRWLYWLFLPALLLAYFSGETLVSIILGGGVVALIFFIIWFVSKKKWLGSGDIYLGAALGLSLGWPLGLLVLVFAFWLGTLFGLPLVFLKKWGRKTIVPFGPFLIVAWLVVLFFQSHFGRFITLLFGYWRI